MKRIFSGALALLLITGAAQAQKAQPGKEGPKHQMEQLNLTADQKAKLKTIRESHQKEWKSLQQQDNLTAKEWKARREALAKKQRTEMNSVLTPEQQQQFAKMHEGGRNGKKGDFRQHGNRFKSELNLTESQQAKMKDLNQSFKTKREALRSNTALSESQKKEQMQTLAKQHRQEVKSILTPEQQQKMESLRQEHKGKNGK